MKTILLAINFVLFSALSNAQSVTWNGNIDSNWGNTSNWSTNKVPTQNDSVIIPPSANNPVIDMDRSVGNILIQFDATLDFGSKKLFVNKDFTNDGNTSMHRSVELKIPPAKSLMGISRKLENCV